MRRPPSPRTALVIAVTMLAAVTATFAGGAPAFAAHTWTCVSSSANITDPNTAWHWSTKWTCESVYGAPLYADALGPDPYSGYTQTATMQSTTTTWFVCYRHGSMHSGGNDVWYYTQGDVATAGMEPRGKWGYMQAAKVYTNTDPWPGMPACPSAYSPPQRTDSTADTVLMIHGYSNPLNSSIAGFNCNSGYWQFGKNTYLVLGFSSVKTIKYYAADTNCDADIGTAADRNKKIEDLASAMAWYIYRNYSRYGDKVDVVAHSMGGLIIRAAIAGVANRTSAPFSSYSWPPYLYVEDVSTLGTPFEGSAYAGYMSCPTVEGGTQCSEMVPGSTFLDEWITAKRNPQALQLGGRGGTDWTFIGSWDDGVVQANSALEWATYDSSNTVGHKVLYKPGMSHMGLVFTDMGGGFSQYYCDYYNPCDQTPAYTFAGSDWYWISDGWNTNTNARSPLEVAAYANMYASGR